MSRKEKMSAKSWGIIIPSEWENAKAIVGKAKTLSKKYYWIEHDKDFYIDEKTGEIIPKKNHIHLLMTFSTARSLTTVKNYFAEFSELKENSYEKINNMHGQIRYQIHADNPEKFQYYQFEINTNDVLLDNYFIEKKSGLQENTLFLQTLQSSAVNVCFQDWIAPLGAVLEGMNSYQRAQTYCNYYKIWLGKRTIIEKENLIPF
jgi:hypothetical protein